MAAPTPKPRRLISTTYSPMDSGHPTSNVAKSDIDSSRSIDNIQTAHSSEMDYGKSKNKSSTEFGSASATKNSGPDIDDSLQDPLSNSVDNRSHGVSIGGMDLAMRAIYPSSPKYSMAMRHRPSEHNGIPGPGAYKLPEGSGYRWGLPGYSISSRRSWYASPHIVEYKE